MDKYGLEINKNTPLISIEISLLFDNETEMEVVTEEIGLVPTSYKNKSEQRKSPFKDDKLEGYWSIKIENFKSYYLEDLTSLLVRNINPSLEKIKNVTLKYDAKTYFLIVSNFKPLYTPALSFDREFLEVVEYLKATIGIDMYVGE